MLGIGLSPTNTHTRTIKLWIRTRYRCSHSANRCDNKFEFVIVVAGKLADDGRNDRRPLAHNFGYNGDDLDTMLHMVGLKPTDLVAFGVHNVGHMLFDTLFDYYDDHGIRYRR